MITLVCPGVQHCALTASKDGSVLSFASCLNLQSEGISPHTSNLKREESPEDTLSWCSIPKRPPWLAGGVSQLGLVSPVGMASWSGKRKGYEGRVGSISSGRSNVGILVVVMPSICLSFVSPRPWGCPELWAAPGCSQLPPIHDSAIQTSSPHVRGITSCFEYTHAKQRVKPQTSICS